VGFHPDQGSDIQTARSAAGNGFLAQIVECG
jgi:hypothetical protein